MTIRETIIELHPDEQFLFADGLDDAILGIDTNSNRVIYSIKKCLTVFKNQGMGIEEAYEFLWFNTINAYVGELTPIWCEDDF